LALLPSPASPLLLWCQAAGANDTMLTSWKESKGSSKIVPLAPLQVDVETDGENTYTETSTGLINKPQLLLPPISKARERLNYFVRHLNIFFICLAVYCCLVGALIVLIFLLADVFEEDSKDMALAGEVAEFQHNTIIQLSLLASKLNALGLSALSLANCTEIVSLFPTFSETIRGGSENPVRYYFDAAGAVAAVYPSIDFDGLYYSNHSFLDMYDEGYNRAKNRRDVSMSLPFAHADGYKAAYMYLPLWLPATDPSADVGCDSYTNCTDDCWSSGDQMKFMGMVRALIQVDYVLLNTIKTVSKDSHIFIHAKEQFSDDVLLKLFCTDIRPKKPVTHRFDVLGLTVVVQLTKVNVWNRNFHDPWAPAWKYRLSLFILLMMLPFCISLYGALVSQEKYSRLLSLILPQRVIEHLSLSTGVFSEEFSDITVLFSDICSFTPLAAMLTPIEIVGMLDELYSLYDDLALKHGVYKIETIGEVYMVSCGCPDKVDSITAAARMVAMAQDMRRVANAFRPSYLPKGMPLRIRIGINSGGVVAGVVGRARPRYCLFGDVVNTASRMGSTCEPMKIQLSHSTYRLIENSGISVTARGFVEVKGKGSMKTYYVDVGSESFESVASLSLSASLMPSGKNVAFSWIPGRGVSIADDDDSSLPWGRSRSKNGSETPTDSGSDSFIMRNARALSARMAVVITNSGPNSPVPTQVNSVMGSPRSSKECSVAAPSTSDSADRTPDSNDDEQSLSQSAKLMLEMDDDDILTRQEQRDTISSQLSDSLLKYITENKLKHQNTVQ
jgi:class 3 adenylate cyclase